MSDLLVNEIFAGLEGEGHNPGTPTVRVRLQGCSVRQCKIRALCDQQEAIPGTIGRRMSVEQIVVATLDFDRHCSHPIPWVSISGGEPLDQVIEPLIWALQSLGKKVRVETSGPRRLEGPVDYIRVSPKRAPEHTKQDWGLELSVVHDGDEEALRQWEAWGNFAMRTLQPLDRGASGTNAQDVIAICQRRPIWQLSVQVHKLLGIR